MQAKNGGFSVGRRQPQLGIDKPFASLPAERPKLSLLAASEEVKIMHGDVP